MEQEAVQFFQRRSLLEEFRWNLKRLLREGFPEGLPLHTVEGQYNHWLGKTITPQMLDPNSVQWRQIFFNIPDLKQTFKIFKRDNIDVVRVCKGVEDPDELQAVLRLASFEKFSSDRLQREFLFADGVIPSAPANHFLDADLNQNTQGFLPIPVPSADGIGLESQPCVQADAEQPEPHENLTQPIVPIVVIQELELQTRLEVLEDNLLSTETATTTSAHTLPETPSPPTDDQVQASVISSSLEVADSDLVTLGDNDNNHGSSERESPLRVPQPLSLEHGTHVSATAPDTNEDVPVLDPVTGIVHRENELEESDEDDVVFLSDSASEAPGPSRQLETRLPISEPYSPKICRPTIVPLAQLPGSSTPAEFVMMNYLKSPSQSPPERQSRGPAITEPRLAHRSQTKRSVQSWGSSRGRGYRFSSSAISYMFNMFKKPQNSESPSPRELPAPIPQRRGRGRGKPPTPGRGRPPTRGRGRPPTRGRGRPPTRNGSHGNQNARSMEYVELPARNPEVASNADPEVVSNPDTFVNSDVAADSDHVMEPEPVDVDDTVAIGDNVLVGETVVVGNTVVVVCDSAADTNPVAVVASSVALAVDSLQPNFVTDRRVSSPSPVNIQISNVCSTVPTSTPNIPITNEGNVQPYDERHPVHFDSLPTQNGSANHLSTPVIDSFQLAAGTALMAPKAQGIYHEDDGQVAGPSRGIQSNSRRKRQSNDQNSLLPTLVDKRVRNSNPDEVEQNNFNQTTRSVIKGVRYSLHGCKGEPVLKRMEQVLDSPHDWMVFPVQADPSTDETASRGFYRCETGLKVQLYRGSAWRPYTFQTIGTKNLYLPENTLVYGEFVDQCITGKCKYKYPLTVFHIIDAAVVGGLDVSKLRFSQRRRLCISLVNRFMEQILKKDYIFVKLKPAGSMRNMKTDIFDSLVAAQDKDEVYIPDEMYVHRKPFVLITGILFMKVMKDTIAIDFTECMNNRFYWRWTSGFCLCAENLNLENQDPNELALWMFQEHFFINEIETDTRLPSDDEHVNS